MRGGSTQITSSDLGSLVFIRPKSDNVRNYNGDVIQEGTQSIAKIDDNNEGYFRVFVIEMTPNCFFVIREPSDSDVPRDQQIKLYKNEWEKINIGGSRRGSRRRRSKRSKSRLRK